MTMDAKLDRLKEEFTRANDYLREAKQLLLEGHAWKAKSYARRAAAAAKRLERLRDRLLEYIAETEHFLYELHRDFGNVTAAYDLLDKAKFALIAADYGAALAYIEQCRHSARKASFRPLPFFEKDIKLKTIIGSERGKVRYRVRLENDTDESIPEVLITPFVPSEVFALSPPEQIVGPLAAHDAVTSEFILKPKVANWSLVTAGKLIQGRDVTIKTVMVVNGDTGTYKIKIENNRPNPLTDVTVFPTLPDWLTTTESTKTVSAIPARDAAVVEFTFIPRSRLKVPHPAKMGATVEGKVTGTEAEEEVIEVEPMMEPEPKPAVEVERVERPPAEEVGAKKVPAPEPEPEPEPELVEPPVELWSASEIDAIARIDTSDAWERRHPNQFSMAYAEDIIPPLNIAATETTKPEPEPEPGLGSGQGSGRLDYDELAALADDEFVVEEAAFDAGRDRPPAQTTRGAGADTNAEPSATAGDVFDANSTGATTDQLPEFEVVEPAMVVDEWELKSDVNGENGGGRDRHFGPDDDEFIIGEDDGSG